VYRQIQLICCYTNVCFKKSAFLGLTVAVILIDVTSFTACISSAGTLAPRILFVLVIISLNLNAITLIAYRFPGMVNRMSQEVIRGWKKHADYKGIRCLEYKFMKSCQQIKIRFGDVNFFEVSTCLVIVDFKLQQTINLKLVTQGRRLT